MGFWKWLRQSKGYWHVVVVFAIISFVLGIEGIMEIYTIYFLIGVIIGAILVGFIEATILYLIYYLMFVKYKQ